MAKMEKVLNAVEGNQTVLMLVNGKKYNSLLLDLIKSLVSHKSKVLYVTLNRPASKLIAEFEKRGIKKDLFYFIDVISTDIKFCEPLKNCEYVAPNELTELSIMINDALAKWKPSLFILDSFHTMQAYQETDVIGRFAHDVIAKLDTLDCKGIFPMVAADRDEPLTHDLEMFVDYVLEVK
jgi:hypothetical protein